MFYTIDILGTIAFAISGVLVAMNKKMDLFGILIIAFVGLSMASMSLMAQTDNTANSNASSGALSNSTGGAGGSALSGAYAGGSASGSYAGGSSA